MTIHVALSEAGERLSELVARVRDGEDVVLTENGKPLAVLSAAAARLPTGSSEDKRTIFDVIGPHPADEIEFEIPRMSDAWGFRMPDFET